MIPKGKDYGHEALGPESRVSPSMSKWMLIMLEIWFTGQRKDDPPPTIWSGRRKRGGRVKPDLEDYL